jgi:hypothetical protein
VSLVINYVVIKSRQENKEVQIYIAEMAQIKTRSIADVKYSIVISDGEAFECCQENNGIGGL